MHSATVVSYPSVERGDGKEEELQEGDREVAPQGEEGEEAFQEAYPLQGGENSLKNWGGSIIINPRRMCEGYSSHSVCLLPS